jgi:hypothetical protein
MDLLDARHRHTPDSSSSPDAAADMGLPLAGAAYQPYVSELLSFSIERLHKVRTPTLAARPLIGGDGDSGFVGLVRDCRNQSF